MFLLCDLFHNMFRPNWPSSGVQQSGQSPNDHLQDNTGIPHVAHDNVLTTDPLHPTCNPFKWEITHVHIQEFITSHPPRKEPDQSDQYTGEITLI
jgi:hypothetical protein